LGLVEVWLAKFPRDLADQFPAPLGVADLKMSPLTPEAKDQLKQELNAGITDSAALAVVMSRLDEILRNEPPNWDGANSWADYVRTVKEPSAEELARFHAGLACDDTEGSVASRLAAGAKEIETEHFREGYAKPLASTLLNANCNGGTALTAETRAALKNLALAP
jgi:hypothetical protein